MLNSLMLLFIMAASLIGYLIKSLTVSGALASFVIGALIYLGFSLKGIILLGVFFITSSLWSKFKRNEKKKIDEITLKGERRDYIQVMANGLVPAFCSLIYFFSPSDYLLIAFIISIAAANADTWASEIGSLSKKAPFHITKLRSVEPGTSGAISFLGTLASILGALLISVLGYFIFNEITYIQMLIIGFAGYLGSVWDTLIGATVQAKYRCESCHRLTEKRSHCHTSTVLVEGSGWIDNDLTNIASIVLATTLGVIMVSLLNFLG